MKKIMFNDKYGLTQAVLEGRKTMTRRIVRNPEEVEINGHAYLKTEKLRYKVGEIVAVAQSYHSLNLMGYVAPEELDLWCEDSAGYENKMFVRADLMPNQIRIKNVRIERLQDISREDCLREGVERITFDNYSFEGWKFFCHDPREAYAALIDKVSGKGTWDSNPWVFVYEFELVK